MDELNWRKASYSGSGGGSCVEVADAAHVVLVRDTTQEGDRHRLTLSVPAAAWQRFMDGIKQAQ
jgi:hypothetical protein